MQSEFITIFSLNNFTFNINLYQRVIESKNKDYPVGATIFGQFGWQTHTIFNPSENKDAIQSYVLPSFGKLPSSLGLGVLGMPG